MMGIGTEVCSETLWTIMNTLWTYHKGGNGEGWIGLFNDLIKNGRWWQIVADIPGFNKSSYAQSYIGIFTDLIKKSR